MAQYRLISADSHVNEPPDLWVTRVDQKYRERAPRLAMDLPGKEGAYFLYEGYAPHPIGIGFGAGKSPDELKTFLTQATYADARPGGEVMDDPMQGGVREGRSWWVAWRGILGEEAVHDQAKADDAL